MKQNKQKGYICSRDNNMMDGKTTFCVSFKETPGALVGVSYKRVRLLFICLLLLGQIGNLIW